MSPMVVVRRLLYVINVVVVISIVIALVTNSAQLWYGITMLGDEVLFVVLMVLIYVVLDSDLGIDVLSVLVLAAALNIVLKRWLALPRPPPSMWRVPAEGYGFPSGHAQLASAFWAIIALRARDRRVELFASITILGASIVIGVALSRLMLGVHFLHDVLGGAALGLGISMLYYYVAKKRSRYSVLIACSASSVLLAIIGILFLDGVYTLKLFEIAGIALPLPLYALIRSRLHGAEYSARHKILALIAITPAIFLIALARSVSNFFVVMVLYAIAVIIVMVSPLLGITMLQRFKLR